MDMTHSKPVVINCSIGDYPRPMPVGMLDPMPKVKVQFDNGEEKDLFEFYPDEISFTESEFIGLTEDEVHELRMKKDIKYIQS